MSDDKDNPFGQKPPDNPFGAPPGGDPFGGSSSSGEYGSTPPPAPASEEAWRGPAAPGGPPSGGGASRADGAITSLVLGIVGLVVCPLCAPFAWVMGSKAEKAVDASGGHLSGRGEATAGKILGIITCALYALGIVLLIGLIAVGAGITSTSP